MDGRGRGSRGQALPLLLVVMGVVFVALAVLVRVGETADDAARARTAADAAALAGAADGEHAARRLAMANGGRLEAFRAWGTVVEVEVRIGSAVARARAERVVEWRPSGG